MATWYIKRDKDLCLFLFVVFISNFNVEIVQAIALFLCLLIAMLKLVNMLYVLCTLTELNAQVWCMRPSIMHATRYDACDAVWLLVFIYHFCHLYIFTGNDEMNVSKIDQVFKLYCWFFLNVQRLTSAACDFMFIIDRIFEPL